MRKASATKFMLFVGSKRILIAEANKVDIVLMRVRSIIAGSPYGAGSERS